MFLIPKNFSARSAFGSWQMGMSNLSSWSNLLADVRAPVYLWRTKFLSFLLDGVSYDFIANLNFIGFFIGVFLIYILVKNLTENKKAALASSLFYLLNPIIFFFSLTQDYALPALFFMLLSLCFLSIKIDSEDYFFLLPAFSSALLAAGSRVEYIFFPFLLILFILILSKKNELKSNLLYIFLFFLAIIPRTISSLSMYFIDAQHDTFLHARTYNYSKNIFSYVIKVIIGTSDYFLKNIEVAWNVLTNPYNLNLIFLILGVISILFSIRKDKKLKKVIFLFSASFLFLIFYYCYFHAVEGIQPYRYTITVLTPLLIVAGIGFGTILKRKEIIYYSLLEILFLFTFITLLFPLTLPNKGEFFIDQELKQNSQNQPTKNEYLKYKKLSYENNISRLFNTDFDIEKGENTYFISNGSRHFIHGMPVSGNFIVISSENNLTKFLKRDFQNEDKIYIIQSELGIRTTKINGFRGISPKIFEEKIKDLFVVKKRFISYYNKGHHVFFFEVKPKND
ncbi:MAG: glycosyltransferase family 39 protein [archaeon]